MQAEGLDPCIVGCAEALTVATEPDVPCGARQAELTGVETRGAVDDDASGCSPPILRISHRSSYFEGGGGGTRIPVQDSLNKGKIPNHASIELIVMIEDENSGLVEVLLVVDEGITGPRHQHTSS